MELFPWRCSFTTNAACPSVCRRLYASAVDGLGRMVVWSVDGGDDAGSQNNANLFSRGRFQLPFLPEVAFFALKRMVLRSDLYYSCSYFESTALQFSLGCYWCSAFAVVVVVDDDVDVYIILVGCFPLLATIRRPGRNRAHLHLCLCAFHHSRLVSFPFPGTRSTTHTLCESLQAAIRYNKPTSEKVGEQS